MKNILLITLFCIALIASPAWSQTTTEVIGGAQTPSATVGNSNLPIDLVPEDDKDVFDPKTVRYEDGLDIAYDAATDMYSIAFWCDPLNNWIGEPPAGAPPYRVFLNGVPEGTAAYDANMGSPEAYPLLTSGEKDKKGRPIASPDNTVWLLKVKDYKGHVRYNISVVSADRKRASGNISYNTCTYIGGQQTGYDMEWKGNGKIETEWCYDPSRKPEAK